MLKLAFPGGINNRSILKLKTDQKKFYLQGNKRNHQNLKKSKKYLQQLIASAKAETKIFDTEQLNSSKDASSGIGTTNLQGIKL